MLLTADCIEAVTQEGATISPKKKRSVLVDARDLLAVDVIARLIEGHDDLSFCGKRVDFIAANPHDRKRAEWLIKIDGNLIMAVVIFDKWSNPQPGSHAVVVRGALPDIGQGPRFHVELDPTYDFQQVIVYGDPDKPDETATQAALKELLCCLNLETG